MRMDTGHRVTRTSAAPATASVDKPASWLPEIKLLVQTEERLLQKERNPKLNYIYLTSSRTKRIKLSKRKKKKETANKTSKMCLSLFLKVAF